MRRPRFENATFEGQARFGEAKLPAGLKLVDTAFNQPPTFHNALISSKVNQAALPPGWGTEVILGNERLVRLVPSTTGRGEAVSNSNYRPGSEMSSDGADGAKASDASPTKVGA
jgi:hypothetical protein